MTPYRKRFSYQKMKCLLKDTYCNDVQSMLNICQENKIISGMLFSGKQNMHSLIEVFNISVKWVIFIHRCNTDVSLTLHTGNT